MPRVVRVVTVDLWGTLFLDTPGADNRYKNRRLTDFDAILRRIGVVIPSHRLDRAYDDSALFLRRVWSAHRDVAVGEHVMAILRALDPALAERTSDALRDELVEAYARPALLVPPTFDESARPALEQLRAHGILLVLVSNTMRTPGRTLRLLLDNAGLLACFARTVFSDEIGVRKPDPAIFQLALADLSVAPADAVHVGDDSVLDVEGARGAGMRVVQVVGRGGEVSEPPPDRTVTKLGELPAAIASLENE
jgi:HAD superfamily hydrolase (TIGR01509 family)